MWTPPERIKHALPEVRWPSAEEAARSRWFSPVRLGPLEARQRTWVPAMVPWRATEGGEVTDDVLDWYGRFADGRPGVIVVEATGIRDVPSGPLLRVGHDRFVPGLFADGAARALGAGFDGIELHYAHAYTMASFLSAKNTRDDGYGGAREQRARLPLEVIAAVRARIGSRCLGARFLSDEVIEGG